MQLVRRLQSLTIPDRLTLRGGQTETEDVVGGLISIAPHYRTPFAMISRAEARRQTRACRGDTCGNTSQFSYTRAKVDTRWKYWVAFCCAASVACQDSRKSAVEDVIRFTQEMPYTIGASMGPPFYSPGYEILVEDDRLEQYNRVFQHLDAGDPFTRPTHYRVLPEELLRRLPISAVESKAFRKLGGDTLLATIAFRRPERSLFLDQLHQARIASTTTAPSAEAKATFANALERARKGLQETDTVFLSVIAGPHILPMTLASDIRDQVAGDSIRRSALGQVKGFVGGATLTATKLTVPPPAGKYGDTKVSAMLEGRLAPGPGGWYGSIVPQAGNISVECEGLRGAEGSRTNGYYKALGEGDSQSVAFTCVWARSQADQWTRVRPEPRECALLRMSGLILLQVHGLPGPSRREYGSALAPSHS